MNQFIRFSTIKMGLDGPGWDLGGKPPPYKARNLNSNWNEIINRENELLADFQVSEGKKP